MELKEIVCMAKKGNTDAMNRLYETYSKSIYFLCLKILPSEEDAEDIAQDTFCTMIEKIHTLKNPDSFENWLQATAINKCKDFIRKKKPQLIADNEKENIENMVTTEDGDFKELLPQSKLDNDETLRIIDKIVDGLSEKQRTTIMLYYYCNMSIKEIAEKLECSIGTIKSRMNNAREQVRKSVLMYEEQGIKLYSGDVLSVLRDALVQLADKVSVPESLSSAVQSAVSSVNGISGSVIGNTVANKVSTSVSTSVANTVSHTVSSKISVNTSIAVAAMCVGIGIGVVVPQPMADRNPVETSEVVKNEISTVIQEEVHTVYDTSTVYKENDPITLYQTQTSTVYEIIEKPITETSTVYDTSTIYETITVHDTSTVYDTNTIYDTSTVYVDTEPSKAVIDNTSYYDLTTDDGFTFRIYDKSNSATLISYKPVKSESTVLTIPDKADGFPVTRIFNNAFRGNQTFETVTIPDTLTSISSGAFRDCTNLKEINIPESVTEIANSAFDGCSSLETVTMGDNVYSIGSNAFKNCKSLKNIILPKNLTEIGDNAFDGCTSLDIKSIPEGVFSLGSETFKNCGITSFDFSGSKIIYMDNGIFSGCSSLKNISLPTGITEIGTNTFSGCSSLKSVIIPDGIARIGNSAFSDCSSLEDITIPDSVKDIDYNVFDNCYALKYIYGKPDSIVEKIANYYRGKSESVEDDEDFSDKYICEDGIIFTKDKTELVKYPLNKKGDRYTIPYTVKKIWDRAFYGCKYLYNVKIPNSVTSIGNYAFYGCDSLEKITIPNSVTSIGDYAFYNCILLNGITIPDSVTSIGDYAFCYCGLKNITLSDNVKNIGKNAFYGCSSIAIPSGVTYISGEYEGKEQQNYNVSFVDYNYIIQDNAMLTKDKKKLVKYMPNKGDIYTIPDGITVIGDHAFAYSWLESITIPDSVVSIDDYAFIGSDIDNIIIPDSVTKIGKYAFSECWIGSITIPKSVTSIGEYVFGDSLIGDITISDGVASIDDYAFIGSNIDNITIPKSVTSIGDYAFAECDHLKNIIIPSSVKSIGDYAFYNCENMQSVTILPDSVTSIGDYAFSECDEIKSLTIPESVTEISNYAFGDSSFLNIDNLIDNLTVPDKVKYLLYCGSEGIDDVYEENGVLFNSDKTEIITYSPTKFDKTYTIPDTVTKIRDFAFYGCESLESITIPDSVTSIGDRAFCKCTNLSDVVIPDSVKLIVVCYVGRSDGFTIIPAFSDNTTIYGTKGSYAEKYAKEYNLKFSEIQ
ncbi:MAG: sigma-70 family RNA polymerase sigma factor [Clostridia bacterium]|nr:sigma-70 family RNA polymerase sigma factor [Clostridia bacterium]